MKVNINRALEKEIILSIGMIVKNEEKHLENCLSALKRFMDQVSCELIIVDTGSTDRTKEIALKYTDKVYDFEWIDDFSAARNFGLEKAKGKWFMFLDADEYMDEDVSQMVAFFTYPEVHERFNSASYVIRNYNNNVTKQGKDFLGSRIVRLTPEVRFEGKIHEYLEMTPPHGYLDTVFHHYGYANGAENVTKKKKDRNMPSLLKQYEENPDDARTLYLLIEGHNDSNTEEINKYLEEALEAIKLPKNQAYKNMILLEAIKVNIISKKWEKALEMVDVYFGVEGNENNVLVLNVYIFLADIYSALMNNEKIAESYENYFKAYERYKNHELNLQDLRFTAVMGCSEYEYQVQILKYIQSLCMLQRYEEAQAKLKEIDIAEISKGDFKTYIGSYCKILENLKDYKQATELYAKVLEINDQDKINFVLQVFEEYFKSYELERESFVNAMIESGIDGLYVELMNLVKADNNGENIARKLDYFIEKPISWKYGYSEAIYLCIKHNVDLNCIISKMGHNELRSHFPIIASAHSDYAKLTMEYCQNVDFTQDIKSLLWMTSALETAVLSSYNLYSEEREELYNLFICTLSDYVFNIYNPELLNPQDIEVLPELHRFGYYMTVAFIAKDNGDAIGYIRGLRDALKLCESMKDLVSFYLDKFEKEMKER